MDSGYLYIYIYTYIWIYDLPPSKTQETWATSQLVDGFNLRKTNAEAIGDHPPIGWDLCTTFVTTHALDGHHHSPLNGDLQHASWTSRVALLVWLTLPGGICFSLQIIWFWLMIYDIFWHRCTLNWTWKPTKTTSKQSSLWASPILPVPWFKDSRAHFKPPNDRTPLSSLNITCQRGASPHLPW